MNVALTKRFTMKQTYLFAAALILTGALSAQPIIDSANVQTGLSFDLYTVTNPGTSNPSPTGANITYDFTSATIALLGTATIADMQNCPFASSYPDCNIGYHVQSSALGVDEWIVLRNSGDKLEEYANGLGGNNPTYYTEIRSVFEYPFIYNTSFTDTYTKQGQAQVTFTRYYDAYGTVQTPLQTFTNIFRVSDTNGYTQFWNASPLHPIVEIDGSDVTVWIPSTANGIQSAALAEVTCFPNPATDVLNVTVGKSEPVFISIFSLDGKVLSSTNSNAQNTSIDIKNLPSGVYFVSITTATESKAFPFVKQ